MQSSSKESRGDNIIQINIITVFGIICIINILALISDGSKGSGFLIFELYLLAINAIILILLGVYNLSKGLKTKGKRFFLSIIFSAITFIVTQILFSIIH